MTSSLHAAKLCGSSATDTELDCDASADVSSLRWGFDCSQCLPWFFMEWVPKHLAHTWCPFVHFAPSIAPSQDPML